MYAFGQRTDQFRCFYRLNAGPSTLIFHTIALISRYTHHRPPPKHLAAPHRTSPSDITTSLVALSPQPPPITYVIGKTGSSQGVRKHHLDKEWLDLPQSDDPTETATAEDLDGIRSLGGAAATSIAAADDDGDDVQSALGVLVAGCELAEN